MKVGDNMRRKKQKLNIGIIFAMLGLGLILAFTLPPKFLVVVLSIALVICGFSLFKLS